jgi:hypothetical protein
MKFTFIALFFLFFGLMTQTSFAVTCPTDDTYSIVSGVCVPTDTGLSDATVADVLLTFMNWILGILGFFGIIAFVISGIQYLVSAGDDDTISTAKRNMKYSIIGVMVALSGFIIIQAVDTLLKGTSSNF